ARSNLFKCAVFGNDPNWGRILAALGTVDAATCPYDPGNVRVAINGIDIFTRGEGMPGIAEVDLTNPWVHIDIDLAAGSASATVYTNDLTHDYVTENSAYST
ncbi:MAG: bifunctional ornithine acetyltransferase/N-acetylglutamate synthase, partial [Bowdeniella nasicola]|nr:bifunctional ornithine acetyltransferase/N-acetylglutamate synthase [Bowdeniella nasicola]